MPDEKDRPRLKSVSGKPELRSRGFLSHPGTAAASSDGKAAGTAPGRSRGTRSHEPGNDPNRPKALDPAHKPRPYSRKPE